MIAQVVINDGQGVDCGYSYETRLKFARQNNLVSSSRWNTMCKNVALKYGYIDCVPMDVLKASIEVYEYYQNHIKEVDNK